MAGLAGWFGLEARRQAEVALARQLLSQGSTLCRGDLHPKLRRHCHELRRVIDQQVTHEIDK